MINTKLISQSSFNRTVYDQLTSIYEKVVRGISVDNISYFDETLINAFKVVNAQGDSLNDISTDGTINSYQMNTIKSIVRYLKGSRTELISKSFAIDGEVCEATIIAPNGFDARNSFIVFSDSCDRVVPISNDDGKETSAGIYKSISSTSINLKLNFTNLDYSGVLTGVCYFWRYKS